MILKQEITERYIITLQISIKISGQELLDLLYQTVENTTHLPNLIPYMRCYIGSALGSECIHTQNKEESKI